MSTTNDATYAHSAEAKHIVSMNERLLTETQKLREDLKEAEKILKVANHQASEIKKKIKHIVAKKESKRISEDQKNIEASEISECKGVNSIHLHSDT